MDAPLRQPRHSNRTLIGRAVNSRRRNAQATANLRAPDPALDRRSELEDISEYPKKDRSNQAPRDLSSRIDFTLIQQQIVALQLPQRLAGPTCRWSLAAARSNARQGRFRPIDTVPGNTPSNSGFSQFGSSPEQVTKPQRWKVLTLAFAVIAAVGALVGGFLLRTWIEGLPATIASAASGAASVSEPSYSPPVAIDTSEQGAKPTVASPAAARPGEPSKTGISVSPASTKQETAMAPLPTDPAVTPMREAAVDPLATAPQPDTVTKAQAAPAAIADPITVHLRLDAQLSPEQRRRIEAVLAKAGYTSVIVHEMPFSISRSRVGFFQEGDRASAEALITALQGTLDGLELRDYHEYMAAPEGHRLDLWIKS